MVNRTAKQRHLLEDLFGYSEDEDKDEEESDSLEEISDEAEKPTARGMRGPNKERNHREGHNKLIQDYFSPNSTLWCSICVAMPKAHFIGVVIA